MPFIGPIDYAIDGVNKTAWTTESGPATRNQPRKAVFVLAEPIDAAEVSRLVLRLVQDHGGKIGNRRNNNLAGRFRFSVTNDPAPVADPLPLAVREIVSRSSEEWTDSELRAAFSYWRTTREDWSQTNAEIDRLLEDYPEGVNQFVVSERDAGNRRVTHRMDRGNFLSPAEVIKPHTPAFLHPLNDSEEPSRLSLARWLVDRRSPLASRALVNRVWQGYFGTGLVETAEDLGSQAPPASHPELLDWLAVEFMDSGWRQKHLHRLIVNSAAYQQSSVARSRERSSDPNNRLLARGPRVRVEAEIVRDIALSASGLLDRTIGGPSVFPPAPRFLFEPPASYGDKIWRTDYGSEAHRRSLYVQAYRSAPYPPMQVFDAPKRQCFLYSANEVQHAASGAHASQRATVCRVRAGDGQPVARVGSRIR